ncbi:O-acyltransferase like protein [Drosophila rhopaloa]|uniref:Nose resistant-to-fluoxetine protein N-terminal domain-containing protein n=1 Tax=Drosophila rhopaloa TaxID=1041015 RepID=A0ABM5JEN4_DRORH|nr:O-acyltransferase like protein [Drosophila rhopaloa]
MLIALLLIPIIAVLGDGGKCESKSLLMDLLEMVPRHQNSTLSKCEEQLMELRKAWQDQQSWALKALDASGEGFSNFMMGQSTWLGNRFTCRAVHEPVLQDMTNSNSRLLRDVSPIAFDYVVAYIESNSPWQLQVSIKKNPLLHIGLCLPRSCDIPEVEQLIRRSLVSGNSFRCWDMDAKLAYAKKPTLRPHFFESGAVQMLFLVVGGTLLLTVVASRGLGQHSRILGCFDLASNWELAWKPVNPSQENRTINGLRVFTAFSLIGVHVVWYKYFSVDHSLEMLGKVVSMTMRHTYWPSMVEIFFVVSGYLTVLNFLKDEQLQQEIASDGLCRNGRRYLGQFIHRYCRLAPLQFVVILAGVVMMEYQRQVSVLHITDPQDELCRRYSIRNLLFIQNLYPIRDMCGSWTWSLGCDMQLHMLAMLLLFGHTKHPKMVRWITQALLVVSALQSIVMMEVKEVGANFEALYHTNEWSYMSPSIRMLAYIVGGSYAFTHVKGLATPFDLVMPNRWVRLGAVVLIGWLAKQVTMDRLPATSIIHTFMITLRVLVTALASHLIVCGTKPDTSDSYAPTRWLLAILQSEQVQRISRFTYAIYLLNPIVIIYFYHSFSNEVKPDNTMILLFTIACSAICYAMAIVVTLLFEIPYNRMTNLLIKSRSFKKKNL